MDLSIIIPSYNTKQLLDRCLSSIHNSLRASSLTYEILVVDNNSTDGTQALIKKSYRSVRLLQNKTNVGYSRANNAGIQAAKSEYILLLNSDTVIVDDAIEKLYRFAEQHPHTFVGPVLLNEDGTRQASCGPAYTIGVLFFFLFLKGDYFGISRGSPRYTTQVDWVSGACLLGKKADFIDVGLFDEKMFMYMEELELLYRAKSAGYHVYFYADATVIHTGSASSDSRTVPILHNFRGLLYFYHKHMSIIEQQVLRGMLRLKAHIAIALGTLLRNKALIQTYEEALRLV